MPDVSRPKTGSWMPSACRLTRLVSPSFAPIDPLAGLQAVLDDQRLGLVGRVDAEERAACG